MIGLDTNILVRYITQDEPAQSAAATRLIESRITAENPGFVALITLIELVWVLGSCYQQSRQELTAVLRLLISTRQLLVERPDIAHQAIQRYESGNGDFSDAVICIINAEYGCDKTLTFDKKAKTAGMTILK